MTAKVVQLYSNPLHIHNLYMIAAALFVLWRANSAPFVRSGGTVGIESSQVVGFSSACCDDLEKSRIRVSSRMLGSTYINLNAIGVGRIRTFPLFLDSAYDSVSYDPVKTILSETIHNASSHALRVLHKQRERL